MDEVFFTLLKKSILLLFLSILFYFINSNLIQNIVLSYIFILKEKNDDGLNIINNLNSIYYYLFYNICFFKLITFIIIFVLLN